MVYNCTTGSTNPFHWGEVGMILPVVLNVRINFYKLKMFTNYIRIIHEALKPPSYKFILILVAMLEHRLILPFGP